MSVNLDAVSRTMEALLAHDRRRFVYLDWATGEELAVSPPSAASPAGLLPAFLVAGEAVWREATGNGFALDIVRDHQALLGYRLQGIGAGSFATVMLAAMEATAQIAGPSAILVNDLGALWSAAIERIEHRPQLSSRAAGGAAP
jgi:hypothetical protein